MEDWLGGKEVQGKKATCSRPCGEGHGKDEAVDKVMWLGMEQREERNNTAWRRRPGPEPRSPAKGLNIYAKDQTKPN